MSDLRRHAVARTLFAPTTLPRAIQRLGFVQADPIRQPARAQDLILRHRVKDYRAGDLERRYPKLAIEEDFFINHGFLPRATQRLMHPREPRTAWTPGRWKQAQAVLEFIQSRGVVHPREVDAHFAHGKVQNWFGGSSNASTQLLDGMQYRGLIRTAGRAGGVRLFEASALPANTATLRAERKPVAEHHDPATVESHMDALVDVLLRCYAPLPKPCLLALISHLRGGAPQWAAQRRAAFQRAVARLPSGEVDGVTWYWPAGENPKAARHAPRDEVRLLAPFDPIVWDRRRFELFWGWAYRFEAYTPAPKRVRGYYALPMLWRDEVIGWASLQWRDGQVDGEFGYVKGAPPKGTVFKRALADEMDRVEAFLQKEVD